MRCATRSPINRAGCEAERQLADRTGEMEVAEAQTQLMQAAAQLAVLESLRKKA